MRELIILCPADSGGSSSREEEGDAMAEACYFRGLYKHLPKGIRARCIIREKGREEEKGGGGWRGNGKEEGENAGEEGGGEKEREGRDNE